jgi:hypothetical protein
MPVERVGGAFCAPSKDLVGNALWAFSIRSGAIHRLFAVAATA